MTKLIFSPGKPDDDGGTAITKYVLEIDDGKGMNTIITIWMDEWMDRQTGGQMNEWIDEWTNQWMNGLIGGWQKKKEDEWMNKRFHKLIKKKMSAT